jgi:hypothetical protein
MSSRLFAYNAGATISGASQSGNLAVSNDFKAGGSVKWWNGPNEDLGYVIGYPDTTGNRKANGSLIGGNAVGFVRTATKTDAAFLTLANNLTGQNFATASVAANWLNTNGYYTSYSVASIVTTGLAMNLDAGDVASYPGTGLTWSSLVNNYKGTLGTGVGFTSSNGGALTFNGGASAYVNMYSSASALSAITNNISVEAWYQSTNNRPGILRTGISSSGFVFGYFTGTGTSWKTTKYGVIDLNAGAIPQNTAWHHVVLTYSSTTGTRIYIDGVLSSPTSANTTNISAGTEFSIGRSEAVQHVGNIAIFRWYSSVLSATDVLQNFNAVKSRFGL